MLRSLFLWNPDGGYSTNKYDIVGNLIETKNPEGGIWKYDYDALGRNIKAIAPIMQVSEYTYDAVGNRTVIKDPAGEQITYTYDLLEHVKSVINQEKEEWKYTYNSLGDLTEVTDALGYQTKYIYDQESNLLSQEDPLGRIISYKYDELGRKVQQTDAKGYQTELTYDKVGNIVSVKDAVGAVTKYYYDPLNRMSKYTTPNGNIRKYAYDKVGNLIKETDPKGNNTNYQYNALDLLTSAEDALKGVAKYDYDKQGQLKKQTDPNGNSRSWEYNLNGQIKSETNALGNTTSYSYDLAGQMKQLVAPNGNATTYSYSPLGQVKSVDYGDQLISYQYDKVGRMTEMKSPSSQEQYQYDAMGRILLQSNVQLEKQLLYQYDAVGNMLQITNSEDRTTTYTYDERNQIASVMDPEESVSTFEYDGLGREVKRNQANGNTISRQFDKDGNLLNIENKNSEGILSSFTYQYDKNGNKLSQIEADGATTSFQYDALNRLVEVTYPIDKIKEIYKNVDTPNDKINTSKANASTGRKFDANKHFASLAPILPTESLNQTDTTTTETTNSNGSNPSSDITTEPGNDTGDENSNPDDTANPDDEGTDGNAPVDSDENGNKDTNLKNCNNDNVGNNGKNCDDHGNNKDKSNGGGYGGGSDNSPACGPDGTMDMELSFNNMLEDLPNYLIKPQEKVQYSYDAAGNRLSMTNDDGTTDYTYNAANQLVSAGDKTYEYDANGNLTSETSGESKVKYTYNQANQLTLAEFADESYVSYSYDGLGRRIYREEMSWKNYDGMAKGTQKAEENNGNGKQSYQFKADCNSVSNHGNGKGNGNGPFNNPGQGKKIGLYKKYLEENGSAFDNSMDNVYHKETTYLYEGLSNILHKEYSQDGSPYAEYYKGPDNQTVSRKMFGMHGLSNPAHNPDLKTTGGMIYYQYDGMRGVSEVTDRHGDIIEQYRYDAFGGIFTGTTNSYNFNGYTGMAYDAKSDLINMNARWYDASVGHFMTEDTYPGDMSQTQSLNRYSYVMNNPVNSWDPTGHVAESIGTTILGLPEGFTEIPSWVRENTSHVTEDIDRRTVWRSISSPTIETGPTEMISNVQELRNYRQTYQKVETTSWYYQYQEYLAGIAGAAGMEPIYVSGQQIFKESVTYEWVDLLSAEEVSKQNQAEIAKYGIPPDAKVISKQVTLPQQYNIYLKNELERLYSKREPTVPKKESIFRRVLDDVQLGLDIFGLVPGVGEAADGLNSIIYLARGDTKNAALSATAMIPVVGSAGTLVKIAGKEAELVNKSEDATRIVRSTRQITDSNLGVSFSINRRNAASTVKNNGNTRLLTEPTPGDNVAINLSSKGTVKNKPEIAKPGEDLFVGTYNQSRYGNKKTGLNETHTPHHVVQDAVSQTTHGKGITINIRKDIHEQTATFGSKRDLNSPREHLAADIFEMRNLLKQNGYNNSTINTQLQELIRQNKATGGFDK